MKINNSTRFPYPVMSDFTGDYKKGEFSFSAIIEERPGNGKLKMDYTVTIDEPKLFHNVQAETAVAGIFINCPDVYYNQLISLESIKGSLEFGPGQLKGRVSIRPFIWAKDSINGYLNNNLHEDYGSVSWDFQPGSVLAIGNEVVINVGHEKLAPMESIFSLAKSAEVPEGEIRVQTDRDTITIFTDDQTYQLLNLLRGTKEGRSVLLNGIYLPAVMEVLSHLRDGYANFTHRKWFRVFNGKCEHLGINYKTGSFLEDAQKLLKAPIKKIKIIGEEL